MEDDVEYMRKGWDGLTERQREVALLAADGLTNAEIATQLGLKLGTVRNHMATVADRLGIRGPRGNRVRVRVTKIVMEKSQMQAKGTETGLRI